MVVGLELRGQPTTELFCTRLTTTEDSLSEHYAAWNHQSVAAKSWWFTEHQVVHTWITHDDAWTPPDPAAQDPQALDRVVARTRRQLMQAVGDDRGQTPAAQTLQKFLGATDSKGTRHEIFKNGIPAPQLNMEIAVPLDAVHDAYAGLKELLHSSPHKLHYPVILRTTGPARGHLSPAPSAPTTYFGFVSYMTAEGLITAARPLFDDIQLLLYSLGGRPHWGKYFTPELLPAANTDGFPEFCRAIGKFDPQRRFENPTFYRTLRLTPTPQRASRSVPLDLAHLSERSSWHRPTARVRRHG